MRVVRSFLQRFRRAQEGATAVELAFIATPFIVLIFAMMEIGLVFAVQSTLDMATDEASRKIRTGEIQKGGGSAATFKSAVCSEMAWLGSGCSANLYVDVRVFTTFANQAPPAPTVNGAVNTAAMTFTPGAGQNIVLVRTFYQWTLFTPLINDGLVNMGGNKRLISSAAAFRNEPF